MIKKEVFRQLYEANIKMIEAIENLSIKEDMLDSQEYLNWHDDLNTLSLDSNR